MVEWYQIFLSDTNNLKTYLFDQIFFCGEGVLHIFRGYIQRIQDRIENQVDIFHHRGRA